MYILTRHALQRFEEQYPNGKPHIGYEAILLKLLDKSKPCRLSKGRRILRLIKYDLRQDVDSLYRFADGWTFVIVKDKLDHNKDIVITATFQMRPRPEIIES